MALQSGSLGDDSIGAWAGHWQMRESLPGQGAIKLTAEYNFASGDENPTDGSRGTFDQLYPTGHDKYGLADQVGWRNIHHLRAGVEFSPGRSDADRSQLPLVVAGRDDRRPLQRQRRAASPSSPAARPSATSARRSTSRCRGRSCRSCRSPPATRTSFRASS